MPTTPPLAHAIWSIRPLGFPKWMFSASCPMMARSVVEKRLSLNRSLKMVPIRTSMAAELLRPEPLNTLEETFALNPPILPPRLENAYATPAIRDEVVPNMDSSAFRKRRSTVIEG